MLKVIKNRVRYSIVFVCTVVVLCSFSTAQDCYKEYEKVTNYYKSYDYENFTMVYATYAIVNGSQGGVLNNEITKNKSKVKFTNQYMEMYQDDQHILMVSKERKQISIQQVKRQNKIDVKQYASFQQSVDTLKKYYKPLVCSMKNQQGEITAELKDAYKSKSAVKRLVYVYEPQSGKLLQSIIDSEQQGTVRQETMSIAKFKSGNIADPFIGSVASLLATNSKWKEKYKSYKIIDLRSK